jgi:hypothetical protein
MVGGIVVPVLPGRSCRECEEIRPATARITPPVTSGFLAPGASPTLGLANEPREQRDDHRIQKRYRGPKSRP